jgi:molybdate transport system substrate-binding protein
MLRAATAAAVAALLAAACQSGGASVTADEPVLVAAASNLRPAFEELGDEFEASTGERVVFSFGSSGQLAQQIIEGAPVDVYAAADASYVDRVLAAGRGGPASRRTYAVGRLTVWTREEAWGGWESPAEVVRDPALETLAIANPEHAPYGAAARQALKALDLWEDAKPRIVHAQNVADAHRMAATGNADAAFVARSFTLDDARGEGRWVPVPRELHEPLTQDLVVVADHSGRAAAHRFVEFVPGPQGRETLRRWGFVVGGGPAAAPGEER